MKVKIMAVIIGMIAAAVLSGWRKAPDQDSPGKPPFWYVSEMTCQSCGRTERYEANTMSGIMSFGDYRSLFPDWLIAGTEANCIVLCPDCK